MKCFTWHRRRILKQGMKGAVRQVINNEGYNNIKPAAAGEGTPTKYSL